jgi:hypothetical protein
MYQHGQLIKWISEYDDLIVKETGTGIIISSKRYSYGDSHHVIYDVYRNKYNDKMSFEERNIKILKGE